MIRNAVDGRALEAMTDRLAPLRDELEDRALLALDARLVPAPPPFKPMDGFADFQVAEFRARHEQATAIADLQDTIVKLGWTDAAGPPPMKPDLVHVQSPSRSQTEDRRDVGVLHEAVWNDHARD